MRPVTNISDSSVDAGTILTLLLHRTPVLSRVQLATVDGIGTSADQLIAALQRLELVEVTRGTAHPLLELRRPVAVWQPGLPSPDCKAVSRSARSRFAEPEITVDILVATPAAAAQFGGHSGKVSPGQLTHDLHVSQVFLEMRQRLPTRASSWRSEAALSTSIGKRGDPLPDALVRDGRFLTAVEFAGASYGPDRIAELFEYCRFKGFGLEIW